jgi:hypothetical protein
MFVSEVRGVLWASLLFSEAPFFPFFRLGGFVGSFAAEPSDLDQIAANH